MKKNRVYQLYRCISNSRIEDNLLKKKKNIQQSIQIKIIDFLRIDNMTQLRHRNQRSGINMIFLLVDLDEAPTDTMYYIQYFCRGFNRQQKGIIYGHALTFYQFLCGNDRLKSQQICPNNTKKDSCIEIKCVILPGETVLNYAHVT